MHPADLEPADTRALQAVTRLADLCKEVDAAILEAVREARGDGHTWAEIGVMLGVSKQAAQQRYGPMLADAPRALAKPHPPEVLVQLDNDLVTRLDEIARTRGTSRSALLREGAQAVIDAAEQMAADRRLVDAYRHQPEDPALIESAARLAARTTPE